MTGAFILRLTTMYSEGRRGLMMKISAFSYLLLVGSSGTSQHVEIEDARSELIKTNVFLKAD